jgi:hypothetical protein
VLARCSASTAAALTAAYPALLPLLPKPRAQRQSSLLACGALGAEWRSILAPRHVQNMWQWQRAPAHASPPPAGAASAASAGAVEWEWRWEFSPRLVTGSSFDNVPDAVYILFEAATLEGWVAVSQATEDAVGIDMQPRQQHRRSSMLVVWVLFLTICAFVMMKLFIGVIVDNFSQLKQESKDGYSLLLTASQKQWLDMQVRLALQLHPTQHTNTNACLQKLMLKHEPTAAAPARKHRRSTHVAGGGQQEQLLKALRRGQHRCCCCCCCCCCSWLRDGDGVRCLSDSCSAFVGCAVRNSRLRRLCWELSASSHGAQLPAGQPRPLPPHDYGGKYHGGFAQLVHAVVLVNVLMMLLVHFGQTPWQSRLIDACSQAFGLMYNIEMVSWK